jgi:poly(hydroxyalkanoate) depolymerase family esterase
VRGREFIVISFVKHALTSKSRGLRRPVLAASAVVAGLCVGGLAVGPASASAARSSAPASSAPRTIPLKPPASTLQQIDNFGPNPTGLQMFLYVPQHVRPHPAIVVALHYCGGSGPAFFNGTEFASLADVYGFIVIYPSVTPGRAPFHCFDVSTPGALTHFGDSDPVGIVSMVRWAQQNLHASKHRVFATGISSGAMMTNVLLGDYPDVFKAGSVMSGVAFGCFAITDGTLWNQNCASGLISKTGEQWGDIVRGAFPGYHGPRPPIQLWHGTADTILLYPNFGEEVKEWTNVLRARLARTDSPMPTWTHTVFTNDDGRVEVDAYSVAGEDHNLGFHFPDWAQLAIQFFGITGDDHGDD